MTTTRAAQLRDRLLSAEDARRRAAGEAPLAEAREDRWARDLAYAEGRPVLQGHLDYCNRQSHALDTRVTEDGVEHTSTSCARCGSELRYTREQPLVPGQLVRMYPRHAVSFVAEVLEVKDRHVTLTARQPVHVMQFTGWVVLKSTASRWDRAALHLDTLARTTAGSWS